MANWVPGLTPEVLVTLSLQQFLGVYEFIELNSNPSGG